MPTTVTIGTDTYDVYVDDVAGDEYFNGRLGADAWTSATTDDKKRGLVSATRWIDRQNWAGQKTSDAQPLAFPRTGLIDKDGNPVDSATVPEDVETASMELALALLENESLQDNLPAGGGNTAQVKRVKAGSAEVEFFGISTFGTRFPLVAHELLAQFLEGVAGGSTTFSAQSFGTDGVSQFTDDKAFGLNDPFA